MTKLLTKDELKKVLPTKFGSKVSDQVLLELNSLQLDESFREYYVDNILGYTQVLSNGKYKITDYFNAVRFVSHKLLGSSNIESYMLTFPDRFDRLKLEGASDKTISAYASMYAKNDLVVKLTTQSIIPTHIINAPLYQEAINTQAVLMRTAKSEKVRSDAADSLMRELRTPETKKIEMEITSDTSAINELREAARELVNQQQQAISSGLMDAKQAAHSIIKEKEIIDVK